MNTIQYIPSTFYDMFAAAEQGQGSPVVDLFVMFGMGDNLEQSCIQINFFSVLPSCGRVPCTWLHTVHGLPSSLAPPKITVTDKDGCYP